MQFVDIVIESIGKDVAKCNAVVLKQNDTFRYLFIPNLINNSKDNEKCISGKFIVQKKSRKETWDNYDALPLNKLAIGQWINLDLSTSSLNILISYIEKLKEIYLEEGKNGTFGTVRTFVFTNKINSEEKELIMEMFNENTSLKEEIKKMFSNDITISDIIDAYKKGKIKINDIVDNLNEDEQEDVYNVLNAKLINPKFLEENINKKDESFWQQLFKKHPNIIFSIIPSVVHIIEDQPYFGGKAINGTGGSFGDFLYKSNTKNVSIIEIKTPDTPLMSGEYRNVYSPSKELSGSIIQIRKQKDSFLKDYHSIKNSSNEKGIDFNAYDPKSYIIIGNTMNLDNCQLESFELFRNGLKDIEIITYNELIDKLKLLEKNLIN